MRILLAVLLLSLAGCASVDRNKLLGPDTFLADPAPIAGGYIAALTAVQAQPYDPQRIAEYVEAGIAYNDTLCLAWLDRVTVAERSLRLGGAGFDILGGLATTAMGLAQASSVVVASVGAGMTAISGFGKAYDTAILTAPSSYAAQTKLLEMMDNTATQIRDNPAPTFAQAYGQLLRYSRLCSFQTIQAAVNEALASTTTVVAPRSGQLTTLPRPRPRPVQ